MKHLKPVKGVIYYRGKAIIYSRKSTILASTTWEYGYTMKKFIVPGMEIKTHFTRNLPQASRAYLLGQKLRKVLRIGSP